jgi:hypothetical protein
MFSNPTFQTCIFISLFCFLFLCFVTKRYMSFLCFLPFLPFLFLRCKQTLNMWTRYMYHQFEGFLSGVMSGLTHLARRADTAHTNPTRARPLPVMRWHGGSGTARSAAMTGQMQVGSSGPRWAHARSDHPFDQGNPIYQTKVELSMFEIRATNHNLWISRANPSLLLSHVPYRRSLPYHVRP